MRTLARNMTFLMKSIALGKEKFGLPEKEEPIANKLYKIKKSQMGGSFLQIVNTIVCIFQTSKGRDGQLHHPRGGVSTCR